MNSLRLPLKRKWFEMTKQGIKTEDYRELTTYWWVRLVDAGDIYRNLEDAIDGIPSPVNEWKMLLPKLFYTNEMTLGYPKSGDNDRIVVLEHNGIEIREGKPEWGAEQGKLYFVIKHGKILSR